MSKGFFQTLTAAPPLSRLARYTVANGLFYMAAGAFMLAGPSDLLLLATGAEAWVGKEEAYVRLTGISFLVIGWFYVMGGRTNAESFGLATVVDRLLLPFAMGGLWLAGEVEASMVAGITVLDPILGLGAYVIWRSEAGAAQPASD